MARPKSEFLSAFGTALEIFKAIVDELLGLGGNDEDMRKVLTDDRLRKKIAELIVAAGLAVKATFKVTADYGKSLAQMIADGHYSWVDKDVTQEHFPITEEGVQEKEVVVFCFNRVMSSDEVFAELEKTDYRSAHIEELLALGELHPDLQKQFPIVALGSAWQGPDGDRYVPYLYWNGSERGLDLGWFEYDWYEDDRFLAVRK